jgi:hypothetical protein
MNPEPAPKASPTPLILNPRHLEILAACWEYRLLTARDFQHLLNVKSRSYVRRLLRELADKQYVFDVPLPHVRSGGTEKLYLLGRRGRRYLARAEGLPVAGYWLPGKSRQFSIGHLMHDLALARFLIALRVFCNTQQDIRLAEVRTQYEIAREPLLAEAAENSTAGETTSRVVPDAWVNVELLTHGTPHKSSPLLIEIDRGTTWRQVFSQRVAARLSYIRPNGLYRRIFATDSVRILYLTLAGSTRRDSLARWCQQTLVAEDREAWAGVFLFAEAPFETMYKEAHSLFSDAVWVIPGQHTPVRLFGEETNYAGTRSAAGTPHDGLPAGTGGLLAGCAGGSAHAPVGGVDESVACLRYS